MEVCPVAQRLVIEALWPFLSYSTSCP